MTRLYVLLQIIGCAVLIAGVVLVFGRGVGMIVGGIILTVTGAVAEALKHEDTKDRLREVVADGPGTTD